MGKKGQNLTLPLRMCALGSNHSSLSFGFLSVPWVHVSISEADGLVQALAHSWSLGEAGRGGDGHHQPGAHQRMGAVADWP